MNFKTISISYKSLMGAKELSIRFNKTDRFINVYDGNRYLLLFDCWSYNDFIMGLHIL